MILVIYSNGVHCTVYTLRAAFRKKCSSSNVAAHIINDYMKTFFNKAS